MRCQSWEDQVKEINAQVRYERLLIIQSNLYRLLFQYQNPDYRWTCNEYGELFKQLNKLCQEYDGANWRDSKLLGDNYKTRYVVEKACKEWKSIQNGTA